MQDFSSLFWQVSMLLVHQSAAFYPTGPVLLEVACRWEMLKGLSVTPSLRKPSSYFAKIVLKLIWYWITKIMLADLLLEVSFKGLHEVIQLHFNRCKWRGWNTSSCLPETECLERGTNVYSCPSVQGYRKSLARVLWVESDPNHLLPCSLLLKHAFRSSSLFQQWRREEFSKQILRHCSFWAVLNLQNKTVLNFPGKKTM